jgi:hypothetical protein
MKKTWQEKLEDKASLPKVLKLEKGFPCYNAVHKMGAEVGDDVVLVNPSEVVEIMKQVPKGKLITIVEICKKIAKQHNVEGLLLVNHRDFHNDGGQRGRRSRQGRQVIRHTLLADAESRRFSE